MNLRRSINLSTLREIWGILMSRKGRTALVAISIFVGVLGVVTLISASDILIDKLKSDIKQSELPMIQAFVRIESSTEPPIDNQAHLETLRQQTNATDIEGQTNSPFYWRNAGEDRFRESRLIAYSEPFTEVDMVPARLMEGEWPVVGEQELAVERRMADERDFSVGDTLEVRVLSAVDGDDQQIPTETWTISAIVFQPYSQQPDQTMFARMDDARYLANFKGFSRINARYQDYAAAEEARDTFVQQIADQTPYIVIFDFAEDPAQNSFITTTEDYANVLTALAIVALAVAAFLVINVVNALVIEQRQQIGVMKSLGATRIEVFLIFAGVVAAYGLIGVVPGVIAGIPLGYQMAVYVGDFINAYVTSFTLSPIAILLGIGLGIGIPVLSAIIPVYTGTRVTILQAMTNLGLSDGLKGGPIARLLKRIPLHSNVKQSLGSISQKQWRFALTVLALTIATAAFMGVSALFIRLDDALQDTLETFDYQIQLEPTELQDYEAVQSLIKNNVDSVEAVYPGTALAVQVDDFVSETANTNRLIVLGLDTRSDLVSFDLESGTAWQDDPTREGIVLTTVVANQVNKDVGDTIVLNSAGKQLEKTIIGVANFPLGMAFMRWQALSSFAGFITDAPTPNQYLTTINAPSQSDSQITAWGIDQQAADFLPVEQGQTISADQPEQVLISQSVADDTNLSVDDTIMLGDPAQEYTVGGIFRIPPQLQEQVQREVPQSVVIFFWEELARLEGRNLDGAPAPNAFLIVTEQDDPTSKDVDDVIDNINAVLVDNGITASYQNQVQVSEQASDAILSVSVILNIASLIMAAVGAIGLLTTLSIAVVERQREIGVMRSVGARSTTIIAQFLLEGILVGILAWIFAIPIGFALGVGLTELLPISGLIDFAYPPLLVVAGLVGVLIIATISSIWPSIIAARKTVSEILRYQ